MRLHHLAIRVHDLDAAVRFYRDVLGLRELSRPRESAVWLSLDDGILMLERTSGVPTDEPFETTRPGLHVVALAISVAERADWEAKLVAGGFPIAHRSPYSLYVRDPDGNRIALSHHPLTSAAP